MKKLFLLILFSIFFTTANAEKYPNSWKMDIHCKQGSNEYYQRLNNQNRIIINDPYVSESTIEFFKKPSVEKIWCNNEE